MSHRTATRRFLQRIGFDVLHRSLSPRETDELLGRSEAGAVADLQGTREAMEVWLEEELFYFLLLDNFRPRTEAVEDIPRRLHHGELHVRDAIAEIMLSTGFNLRNPGNDTFVTVVLEQCLGMRVQDRRNVRTLEAGKRMYDGERVRFLGAHGSSQADIIKIVVGTRDFARHTLGRHHRRLLGEPIGADDPAIDRFHEDPSTFFDVLAGWMLSDRYHAALQERKPRSDHQFVRALYMDLLERMPSYEELRNMRNAMLAMADPAPLRMVMAKVILDSGRARLPRLEAGAEEEFVTTCFRRYLARDPDGGELPAFTTALRQGAGPEHAVRAIVASVEYQYY